MNNIIKGNNDMVAAGFSLRFLKYYMVAAGFSLRFLKYYMVAAGFSLRFLKDTQTKVCGYHTILSNGCVI